MKLSRTSLHGFVRCLVPKFLSGLALVCAFSGFLFLNLSCTKKSVSPENQSSGVPSIEEGKRVYQSNCIACHAANPHRAGSLGPALAGSSIELLQLRLIQGKYPEAYTPKQKTGQMPLFPHLRNQIPSLQLFLAQEEAAYSSR